jgi:hypothetical protein
MVIYCINTFGSVIWQLCGNLSPADDSLPKVPSLIILKPKIPSYSTSFAYFDTAHNTASCLRDQSIVLKSRGLAGLPLLGGTTADVTWTYLEDDDLDC